MSTKKEQHPENPRNSKPISLYPMKLEEAIRRAVSTPPSRPAQDPKRKPPKPS
jgi:hypothetical protein